MAQAKMPAITSTLEFDDGQGNVESISKLTSLISAGSNIAVNTTANTGELSLDIADTLDITSLSTSSDVAATGNVTATGNVSGTDVIASNSVKIGSWTLKVAS